MAIAEEERHGYGIELEVERRTGGRLDLGPGTLYEAIQPLSGKGLVRRVRRRPGG